MYEVYALLIHRPTHTPATPLYSCRRNRWRACARTGGNSLTMCPRSLRDSSIENPLFPAAEKISSPPPPTRSFITHFFGIQGIRLIGESCQKKSDGIQRWPYEGTLAADAGYHRWSTRTEFQRSELHDTLTLHDIIRPRISHILDEGLVRKVIPPIFVFRAV